MKKQIKYIVLAILILVLILSFIFSYKMCSEIDYDGCYYRYYDGADKLIKITRNISVEDYLQEKQYIGKLYNIDQEGKCVETLMNVDVLNDGIVLFTGYESFYFSLIGNELRSTDKKDIVYTKITEKEFNKYLEEAER